MIVAISGEDIVPSINCDRVIIQHNTINNRISTVPSCKSSVILNDLDNYPVLAVPLEIWIFLVRNVDPYTAPETQLVHTE